MWISVVGLPQDQLKDQYLLNFQCCFSQLSICDMIYLWPWWRYVWFWATVTTSYPFWQPFMYVRTICWFCAPGLTTAQSVAYYCTGQFACTKLGQFANLENEKTLLSAEGDDETVGIESSHVKQKTIIKTKQRWHIWNLRTLPGRNEVYQRQAVSGKNGSLLPGVPS